MYKKNPPKTMLLNFFLFIYNCNDAVTVFNIGTVLSENNGKCWKVAELKLRMDFGS